MRDDSVFSRILLQTGLFGSGKDIITPTNDYFSAAIPFFKEPNAITDNTVNNNQTDLLGTTKTLEIIAAAQRIACVVRMFFKIIFLIINYILF